MEKFTYIYLIINKLNNKKYVGQHTHKRLSNSYLGSGPKIKKAIKEFGRENFEKRILEICSPQRADILEQSYISHYNSIANGYNTLRGRNGDLEKLKLGALKISISRKACKLSERTKNKISSSLKRKVDYYIFYRKNNKYKFSVYCKGIFVGNYPSIEDAKIARNYYLKYGKVIKCKHNFKNIEIKANKFPKNKFTLYINGKPIGFFSSIGKVNSKIKELIK